MVGCPMGLNAAVQPSGPGHHPCMPTACSGGASSAHLKTLEERTASLAAPKPVGSCVGIECVIVGPLYGAPNKTNQNDDKYFGTSAFNEGTSGFDTEEVQMKDAIWGPKTGLLKLSVGQN